MYLTQGSVLGPLFFIIYINDLHKTVKHSNTFHFADDTSLLCIEKSYKKVVSKVNQDLSLLIHWLRANKISLNTSKTEIIICRSNSKPLKKNLNFRISSQKMKLSKRVTYLGMTLDEHLDWSPQLQNLFSKLSRAVGMLSKLKGILPKIQDFDIYSLRTF